MTTAIDKSNTTERVGFEKANQPLSTTVNHIRVGEHHDKVRVVMDLSDAVDYRIERSSDGKEVIVILPDAEWGAVKRSGMSKTSVISGFETEARRVDGIQLRLLAKDRMIVDKDGLLPPQYGRGYRIYIDLMAD